MPARGRGCLAGILHPTRQVCCNVSCGLCGGHGCSAAPGGPTQCCMPAILRSRRGCQSEADVACIFQGSAAANVTHDASMGPRNHAPTSQLFRLTARDALRLLNSSLLPPCKYSMERNVQGDCLPWNPEAAQPFGGVGPLVASCGAREEPHQSAGLSSAAVGIGRQPQWRPRP